MGSRRVRDMGTGPEPVTDEAAQAAIDRQANRIRRRARWVGVAVGVAALLIP